MVFNQISGTVYLLNFLEVLGIETIRIFPFQHAHAHSQCRPCVRRLRQDILEAVAVTGEIDAFKMSS